VTKFRETCADGRGFLVPLLAVYLVKQQLPLYSTGRIIADGTANRKMTILQMNSYMYIVSSNMYVERGVSVDFTCYYMKPEKNVQKLT